MRYVVKSSLAVIVLLVCSLFTLADTIYVNWDGSGDYITIQDGIDAAVGGDEVVVADGTYTGDGNRDIDFSGKAITVRSENGAEGCIIDCEGSSSAEHRGFYFISGEDANSILDGFSIINGYANHGGGIVNAESSPTVINCIFNCNIVYGAGGGMCNLGSSPTVINCTFSNNDATNGGGMCNWFNSNPTVTNCTFIDNYASYEGGGMVNHNSSPTVTNCIFISNYASYEGGGMYNEYSSPMVTNCIFWENYGEIYNEDSTPIVTYSNVWWGYTGTGNIDEDPLFVDAANGDYHLKSEAGRWDGDLQEWVVDDVTSPCIDAGSPNSEYCRELWPHGGRINMGAYGGTNEASMSLSDVGSAADMNCDYGVDMEDFGWMSGKWQKQEVLLKEDIDRDGVVGMSDLVIFCEEWML